MIKLIIQNDVKTVVFGKDREPWRNWARTDLPPHPKFNNRCIWKFSLGVYNDGPDPITFKNFHRNVQTGGFLGPTYQNLYFMTLWDLFTKESNEVFISTPLDPNFRNFADPLNPVLSSIPIVDPATPDDLSMPSKHGIWILPNAEAFVDATSVKPDVYGFELMFDSLGLWNHPAKFEGYVEVGAMSFKIL